MKHLMQTLKVGLVSLMLCFFVVPAFAVNAEVATEDAFRDLAGAAVMPAAQPVAAAQQVADKAPDGGLLAAIGSFLNFMRGHTMKAIMQWVNFLILMFLLGKFVLPLIFSALEEKLTDIENRLNSEEREKRQIEERIRELRKKIDAIDGERDKLIAEAEAQAKTVRENVLTEAREAEMKILNSVEGDAANYYFDKINDLKNSFFGQVVDEFSKEAADSKKDKDLEKYCSGVIAKMEVSHEG